jgi:hypothetical protein
MINRSGWTDEVKVYLIVFGVLAGIAWLAAAGVRSLGY